jgi:hypothetical protein
MPESPDPAQPDPDLDQDANGLKGAGEVDFDGKLLSILTIDGNELLMIFIQILCNGISQEIRGSTIIFTTVSSGR